MPVGIWQMYAVIIVIIAAISPVSVRYFSLFSRFSPSLGSVRDVMVFYLSDKKYNIVSVAAFYNNKCRYFSK